VYGPWIAEEGDNVISWATPADGKGCGGALVAIVAQFGARSTGRSGVFVAYLKKKGRFSRTVTERNPNNWPNLEE